MNALKKYTSPVFVGLLLLSFVLWYLTKLSYTYTSKLPFDVRVAGNKFRVECVVEGTGYKLFAHRFLYNNNIAINKNQLQTTPSVINHGSLVINPFSLQNEISLRNDDLRIISVGELPEILFEPGQEGKQ